MKISYLKCRPKINFPIIAWIIMLFQGMNPFKKSSNSHRALSYFDGFQWWVIDVTGSNPVEKKELYLFMRKYSIIESIEFKIDIGLNTIENWYQSIKGVKYDHSQILGLSLKLLNIISFNCYGKNYKKMICSEVFINFCENILDLRLGDSDNYDLLETDRVAIWVRDNYGNTKFIN